MLLNFKKLYFIFLSLILIIFDQSSKHFIIKNYNNFINKDYYLFSFDLIKNYGAAFNIFSGSRIFLSIVSVFISFIILYLMLRNQSTKTINLYSYSFILGGSLGNGIDRITTGYVVDFIKLNFINFPVFNLADISINIGFLFIMYSLVKLKNEI